MRKGSRKASWNRPPQYYLYDDLPVKMEITVSGGLRVSVFDTATRTFQADSRYGSRVLHDRDNLTRVLSEQEFNVRVQLLRNPGHALHKGRWRLKDLKVPVVKLPRQSP